MVKRVCLVSGGTGGHLMPALVLARALRSAGHDVLLVTEGREVERELLQREGADLREVDLPAGRPSRLGVPLWLLRTTLGARALLARCEVDVMVSTGGRPSVPMALAARSRGVPVFLLEQNAVTGRANRLLAPLARRLYLGLPGSQKAGGRSLVTGTPLRPGLYQVDREAARRALGLCPDQPVVLVTGGSQGAQILNEVAPQALGSLGLPLQVLHLSGVGHDEAVRRAYAQYDDAGVSAQVRPLAMDMEHMLGAADLVICRGGGTTVAELMAAGRAAVIVPYPHHKDRQQLRNAAVLQRAGAAVVIEQDRFDRERLALECGGLLLDPGRLQAMGQAARGLCAVDPCQAILADMAGLGALG
jgi:UDP-N-acetylglucosamine--N-acetylmuramyl-(pentapeptide) pyrophosphoryl-undecaprenol N-acetylglucosamine transferase